MQPESVPNLSRGALERLGHESDHAGVANTSSDTAAALSRTVALSGTPSPERPRTGMMLDRVLTIVLLILTVLILARARITIHIYLDAGVLAGLLIAWIARRDGR